MPAERRQIQKTTCYMIPLIWIFWERQKQNLTYDVWGQVWEWGFSAKSTKGFGGYDRVLKLHCNDGYTLYIFTKISKIVEFYGM